jgi:hypothetical protein
MPMTNSQSMRMRAKLMVVFEPCRVPSNSKVFDGGEPARVVAAKKSVKGFLSETAAALLADQPVEILSLKETLEGV